MKKYSLRYKLVLPFVLIMLLVPAGIGWMLYDSGTTAVNTLARRVLLDVVQQANASTEQHLTAALNALHSFVPESSDTPPASSFSTDMVALEQRAWSITKSIPNPGNYVYFGGTDGRFVGLYRINDYLLELYLRHPDSPKRHIYAIKQQGDRPALLRADHYDPRNRPWYATAVQQTQPVWSPVYNDFTSGRLTITVAKSIRSKDNEILGVAAADVELWSLTEKLMSLAISRNGIAFVVDQKGRILASSDQTQQATEHALKTALLHAPEIDNPLIRAAYQAILERRNSANPADEPLSIELASKNGILNIAAAPAGEKLGVNWMTVVVAPRSDFTGDITSSFNRSLLIAGLCVLGVLLFGLLILDRVLRDIYTLNNAARKIGLGESFPPLHIDRKDELGQLAQTFREMEHNLRTDRLTGAFNREYLSTQIRHLRELSQAPHSTQPHFALFFIDLDNFKNINDIHGHDVGDIVLIEIAARLKAATRTSDIVARYGGDEFVVLLNDMKNLDTIKLTENKIRGIVEAAIPVDGHDIHIGISIGWAIFPEDGKNMETLLKIADVRMFDDKKLRKSVR